MLKMSSKTSREWAIFVEEKYGIKLMDPDGWREDNTLGEWFETVKITEDEFRSRLEISTVYQLSEEKANEFWNGSK